MLEVHLDALPGDHRSATVVFWHAEEGDRVEEGGDLVRLSVERKPFNFTSPVTGVVNDIYYDQGEEIPLGEVIATIEEEKEEGKGEETVEDVL